VVTDEENDVPPAKKGRAAVKPTPALVTRYRVEAAATPIQSRKLVFNLGSDGCKLK
jgi:hypothetical protein